MRQDVLLLLRYLLRHLVTVGDLERLARYGRRSSARLGTLLWMAGLAHDVV